MPIPHIVERDNEAGRLMNSGRELRNSCNVSFTGSKRASPMGAASEDGGASTLVPPNMLRLRAARYLTFQEMSSK
jgi:hypothetical protein